MRRGQASLEYLLVLAALIGFLAVWVPVSESVRTKVVGAAERSEAAAALSRLGAAAEEAYLLGEGNEQEVAVGALHGMTLACEDGRIGARGRGMDVAALADFKAGNRQLDLPERDARVVVRCCSDDGIEFSVSRATP